MGVFDRYAPFVQDFIYSHDWENLRGIQVAAAEAIFDTDDNVLLTASTASGKTEAAFFPILSLFDEDPPASIGAIYIGPLKALINDQFLRLNDLCEEAEIPVWHWHGDVSASHKAKMLKHPGGILQITPESLEALLLHKHSAISRLFCDLRFVVIDEVHSLLRGDRGGQTLCLIERLGRMAGVNPRRIGLSATIGDPDAVGAYLSAGTGRGWVVPRVEEPPRTWRLSMEHFYMTGPQAGTDVEAALRSLREADAFRRAQEEREKSQGESGAAEADGGHSRAAASAASASGITAGAADSAQATPGADALEPDEVHDPGEDAPLPPLADATDTAPREADPGLGYVFEHTRGKKCLVFANSREDAEAVCTELRRYCEVRHEPDRFLIHHGNLSSSIRESAEDAMRDESRQLTTVTTATLELGIDIGRLERAFQLDAPFTVSAFLQRMGRTGRRSQPPEMWFVMREEQPEARALLPETIPWKLLQGIALVQLYREERWVEPPRLDRLPYSLLYHQTVATLASEGELRPAELARRVLNLTVFHRVSADDYRALLRHLIEIGHIEQTETGGLIVGLAGERVCNSFKFYAVFQENEEYTVRSDSAELGTIVQPPPPGEKVAIAGATWIVEEVDHKRHLVYATQVKGRVPAYFGECPGDVHTHVLERMRRVLEERCGYPYLMRNATGRLALARRAATGARMDVSPLVNLGEDTWCLFPWLGSYAFLALERLLKIKCAKQLGIKGLDSSRPYFIQFRMAAGPREFFATVCREAMAGFDPIELLYPDELPVFEKYDEFVPRELVRKGFAEGVLDVAGLRARALEWQELAGAPELPGTTGLPPVEPSAIE
ncbi:DEAD/DEAH box helicase [Olsenella uli]|uniref:DEAD/DEAH box helicase n=1 Tax=Olsenella uli TaxID=133926 RepID=UPI0012AC36CB|nr:DEAD/DEAH box helicase [Olsenella uli]